MSNRYDKEGKPLPFDINNLETVHYVESLLTDYEYKLVDRTEFGPKTFVSTVWLGLDHNFNGGAPLIFETMIFSDNKALDQEQRRYSTLEEAQAGHKSACEYAKKVLLSNVE